MLSLETLCLATIFLPLSGSLVAGLMGARMPRAIPQWLTILCVALSTVCAVKVAGEVFRHDDLAIQITLYRWANVGGILMDVSFLIDRLSAAMMLVVTSISTLIHIYSIGYMAEEKQDARFFSYISAFTFAMLCLVMSNNFLLLFFGWEGVGLVSYLLIGYWFHKETAVMANMKAFIVNRVGDLGFLLGIGGVLYYFGTLDYTMLFAQQARFDSLPVWFTFQGQEVDGLAVICLLMFIGACGKSAQIPLHVWLEGSMEGPTPISALIHAATMVTAGIFMLARLSPMFEYSDLALSTVMLVGSATCFFMGVVGIVQNDIKRVVAYSTLSQLGYMIAAQGASAYSVGMFHLITHACFKALLFLGAGSVILGLHHKQDIREMGGLWKKMPVTYVCMLMGTLALTAIPPFSGFFSKDLIMLSIGYSTLPGHEIASFFVVAGAFFTALYSFRMLFMVFHGTPRMSQEAYDHVHESHWTVLLPLICLAVPSVALGWYGYAPALSGFFGETITILPGHDVVGQLAQKMPHAADLMHHAPHGLPFWLSFAGLGLATVCYIMAPALPGKIVAKTGIIYQLLVSKYFFDHLYKFLFVDGTKTLGLLCWKAGDSFVIDGACVNGSARVTRWVGQTLRKLQTGYVYHYIWVMLIGLLVLLAAVVFEQRFL